MHRQESEEKTVLKSYGNFIEERQEFEFTCLRSEDMQFLFNNLTLELKDHNRAEIRPGFISRTLVDQDFQHTINSLHFLIKGEAILDFEGKKYTLSEGDVFLIGNHVKCTWEYTKPAEELTLLFNIYLGNMDDLFTGLTHPIIIENQNDTVKELSLLFAENTGISAFKIKHAVLGYLAEFISLSKTNLNSHIKTVKKYKEVFKYISEHLSASLSIGDIAKATNYSTGFFTKSFPKDNGITVKEYLHDKLMSEAEQFLIYSDLSIKEISDNLGFCEQAYFTRWFKKYKFCAPTEYRAKIKKTSGKYFSKTP
jgi:AraC-like DNA-binding protein